MSDMIVLELAHPKLIHKDDDPTEPLPPNRKRKTPDDDADGDRNPGFGSRVMKSWRGVQHSDTLTGVHTCWPA